MAALGALKPFSFFEREGALFARTGYTGESGFECIVDASEGVALWQSLRQAGASPIGLGARDTLRLEAGMNLYGQDLDETVCPAAANLSWTVVTKIVISLAKTPWPPIQRVVSARSAFNLSAKGCFAPATPFFLEKRQLVW